MKHEFDRLNDPSLFLTYTRLKNEANTSACRAKKSFFQNKFEKCTDSVSVWETMNLLTKFRVKRKQRIPKLVSSNGSVLDSDELLCNQLADEFIVRDCTSDVSDLSEAIKKYEEVFVNDNPDYKFKNVTSQEVAEAMIYVKKSKDNVQSVPRSIYRQFVHILSIPLAIIFNMILVTYEMPNSFKTASCTPLYKGKGRYSDSRSYRAIYGLSYLTKVFERVLYLRLVEMVNEKLSSRQHGFRPGKSCETAVSYFTQNIFDLIDKTNGKAIAVFIDFSKAFDTVNHVFLLKKLMSKFDNKIEPYMVHLLQNYFSGRKFCIENGDFVSDFFTSLAGTPAGSCLGPLIFSLFINDIGDALSLPFILYADDLVFFVDAANLDLAMAEIRECYSLLCNWCSENSIVINESKTKAMYFL
ncbi:unnamed protein product [Orchesella dallaii]|uniref:Reverse transcriptase domain-containing protein n=1 Tax=Orchesella dallaii TaxID=48710 RepID=A0ABP1RLI3_9HEXA